MSDYFTVKNEANAEFTEKRSRFIGHIKPVSTREEAEEFIARKKSEYWDARHNVYAYVIREGNFQKYSDDGEPQGTAGFPALDVLQKEGVTDCVVVVTRYFGGVLLGTGGLTRAYSRAAKLALNAGEKIEMLLCDEMEVACDYAFYGKLSSFLPDFGAIVLSADFSENVSVKFAVRKDDCDILTEKLRDMSNAKFVPQRTGEGYFAKA